MGFDWEEMFGNTEDLSDAWESACMDAIDQWVSTPPRKKKKDTYCGTWHNQRIQFKQNWGSKHFTDEECKKLCQGKTITFIYQDQSVVVGKLKKRNYNNHSFIGFEKDTSIYIPLVWNHHVFTDNELKTLMEGKDIPIEDAISRKGNPFQCTLHYNQKEKKLHPTFNKPLGYS